MIQKRVQESAYETIYLWAIAGNGKKLCSCGAALHSDGIARKLVEVAP